MADEVEAQIDALYRLALAEFTADRNALATRLGAGGDREGAARVRALAKPSVTAWAANQVYWGARAAFDAATESVRRLRAAQQQAAPGAELREAMSRRREALAAALAQAEDALRQNGHHPTPAQRERIGATLEALALRSPEARPGRLVADLDAPGFEALGEVVAAVRPAPPAAGPEPSTLVRLEAKVEGDRAALQQAQRRAREAAAEVERAETALAAAERALAQARS